MHVFYEKFFFYFENTSTEQDKKQTCFWLNLSKSDLSTFHHHHYLHLLQIGIFWQPYVQRVYKHKTREISNVSK